MPVNDPKTPKPEDIINEVFSSFMKGFTIPTGTVPSPAAKADEPVVDSVKETHRLLKKAEEASSPSEAGTLLQIADRHLRIVDLALSSQR